MTFLVMEIRGEYELDKNVCEASSQADTFMEQCFEKKCEKLKDGADILNQWRTDKEEYSAITNTTGLDFQHYSMHDKSHSVAILNYIEMILGKDRVEILCASDLWLLLESAYCHDIGMSLTYEELCALWGKEEFVKYVKDNLYAETADQRKAAAFYVKLDSLVHDRALFLESAQIDEDMVSEEFEEEFDGLFNKRCWALASVRYVMLLYTGYIRKNHPEESQKKIMTYGRNENAKIKQRMYGVVADVVYLHGEDFEKIFTKVHKSDNGFAAEKLHPQFAAAMLRLGDLLDMDSNRFNLRMLKHMGLELLPEDSRLQFKKHQSISHLSYSSGEIQAEARSDEIEVCITVNRWFAMLDQEVQDLICSWNEIVPEELIGCRLKRCDLKIFLKNELFDASRQTKFQVDPVRVYDMLIGNNIYESRLDFIREYLQNAMDASKMKLWLDWKERQDLEEGVSENALIPFDLGLAWYKQYQIEVEADLDWEKGMLHLAFQDHGIGMERQCIDSLSTVAGDNWRKRSDYVTEIWKMPLWLRPTGGFGIGVQSAFMIADSVEFLTCSEKEGIGRRICLESSRKSGTVLEYIDRTAPKGTRVLVQVKMTEFLKEVLEHKEIFELEDLADNIFDWEEAPGIIMHILKKYIRQTAKYSILPIRIRCGREKEQYVGMEWAAVGPEALADRLGTLQGGVDDFGLGKVISLDPVKRYVVAGEKNEVRYRIEGNAIYLWDCTKGNMVICTVLIPSERRANGYYKGILIKKEEVAISSYYSLDIIYFDDVVGKNLTVNRDMYQAGKRIQYREDIERYQRILAYIFADNIWKFKEKGTTKKIALQILALALTGTVRLSKTQIEKMSEAAGSIAVRTIDFNKLEQIDSYFGENNENKPEEEIILHLASLQMYKNTQISYGDLTESVKKNGGIFCRMDESDNKCDQMKLKNMLVKIREYRKTGKKPDASIPWYNLLFKMMQPDCYTIIEPDLCDTMKTDMGECERKGLNIVIKSKFVDGIVFMEKRKTTESRQAVNLQRFIQRELEQAVSVSGNFPIVLCTDQWMDQEPLWVSRIFPNVEPVSLDGSKRAKSYLILPFTRSKWNGLMREKEKGMVTRKKYDSIVKDRAAASLYIDWTYYWQIASGENKLKYPQVWEHYVKLLDSIYQWMFGSKQPHG